VALSQYGRSWAASLATAGSLIGTVAASIVPAVVLSNVMESRYGANSWYSNVIPPMVFIPTCIVLLFVVMRYWRWLDLWCSCFGCGKSNRVLFMFWELSWFTVITRPDDRSFASRPSPICKHCSEDLREMVVTDD